jgi:beta-lactamase class D
MAKQIQPVNIWINGENKVGEFFQVTCINDNYENSATNYWQIFTKVVDEEGNEKQGEQISCGNLTIDGQDYVNWGDQPAMAINAWIYDWSASKLSLVII